MYHDIFHDTMSRKPTKFNKSLVLIDKTPYIWQKLKNNIMDKVYKINANTPFRYVTDYFKYYRLEDGTHILYKSLDITEFPDGTDFKTINDFIYEETEPECKSIKDCGEFWEIEWILDDWDEDTKEIAKEILNAAEDIKVALDIEDEEDEDYE